MWAHGVACERDLMHACIIVPTYRYTRSFAFKAFEPHTQRYAGGDRVCTCRCARGTVSVSCTIKLDGQSAGP